MDLSCWRLALNGAETVRAQTLDRFYERFGRLGLRREALTPVYGLSEAALAVTFTPPNEPPTVICADREALSNGELSLADDGMPLVSVGKPLDGYSIEIRGPEGDPCPPDTVGTLHVRGPSLLRGYIGIEEQPVEDGWLHTGDRALLHEHYLYIVGRQRDIIVMRGRNHDPAEIESAVGEVPGIRTGCVVAVGSMDDEGEHLWVFAEVREQRKQLAEECLQSIRARCALTADLVALVEPGALPRTSSGKLRRQEALTRFRDGTLMPPARVGPLFMAGAWARSALGYLGAEL